MNWFRFYHEALDDPKVQRLPGETFKAWMNVLCIASRNNPRGYLPDTEYIGFALRTSTDAAQSIIDDLIDRGLIDITDDGLMPHNWPERQKRSDSSAPRVAKFRERNATGNDANNDGNVTGNVTETELKRDGNALEESREEEKREEQKRTESFTAAHADGAADDDGTDDEPTYSPEFLTFWAAYPKKTGKGAAYKRWNQVKPGKALREKMLAAIDAQKHGRQWQQGFIMDPARWLNERHWDDEIDGNQPGTLTVIDPKPKSQYDRWTQHLIDEVKRIRRDRSNAVSEWVIEKYDRDLAEVEAELAARGVALTGVA